MMNSHFSTVANLYYTSFHASFCNCLTKRYRLETEDVEDVYADMWLALDKDYRNKVQTPAVNAPEREWRNFMFKIAIRLAGKRVDEKNRETRIDALEPAEAAVMELELHKASFRPSNAYDNPEVWALYRKEIDNLSETNRKIYTLYYDEGKSMREIAEIMGYSTERSAISTKKRACDTLMSNLRASALKAGFADESMTAADVCGKIRA